MYPLVNNRKIPRLCPAGFSFPDSSQSALLSVDVMNIKAPNHLEKKEMTSLIDHTSSLREAKAGTQSRKLEARTEAESMEERCLLTGLLPGLVQLALLYGSGPPA